MRLLNIYFFYRYKGQKRKVFLTLCKQRLRQRRTPRHLYNRNPNWRTTSRQRKGGEKVKIYPFKMIIWFCT